MQATGLHGQPIIWALGLKRRRVHSSPASNLPQKQDNNVNVMLDLMNSLACN